MGSLCCLSMYLSASTNLSAVPIIVRVRGLWNQLAARRSVCVSPLILLWCLWDHVSIYMSMCPFNCLYSCSRSYQRKLGDYFFPQLGRWDDETISEIDPLHFQQAQLSKMEIDSVLEILYLRKLQGTGSDIFVMLTVKHHCQKHSDFS
jgi:hypothetical protein